MKMFIGLYHVVLSCLALAVLVHGQEQKGLYLVVLSCLALAVLVHGHHDETGFISIDCGAPEESGFVDTDTSLSYSSDRDFVDTGDNMNISSDFIYDMLQRPLLNVRSFPDGNKNCYTLTRKGGSGGKYLIRAWFLYGNYDGKNQVPQFDLYLGVNLWYSVKFINASSVTSTEIITVAPSDLIYVCLINVGLGTPFISALELRPLNHSIYNTESGSLLLSERLDIGSATFNRSIRYKDDTYDRIWSPYSAPGIWDPVISPLPVDGSGSGYEAPSTVMRTAVRPINYSNPLQISWIPSDPTSQFYIFLYFAELEQLESNQSRIFTISRNGSPFRRRFVPRYLHTDTIYENMSLVGDRHQFSVTKTDDSTHPPILNAVEIYMIKQFTESPTYREDVDAIMDIKETYQVKRNWVGDPCKPRNYHWEGLNCSYDGFTPSRIISLNLTASNLTGEIASSIANLKSVESLDLSNNSLRGPVPEFLLQLTSLRILNLRGNQLTGSIPMALIEKSNKGLLSLSVEDNPNICDSDSCKKDRNIIIPIVASVSSALVLSLVLIIVWRLKRGRRSVVAVISNKEGRNSFVSKNQQLTYAEVVSITNNFQRVIGKGGFGTVYHGYLKDGTQVAVKMLSQSSSQGSKEFRTEAELLLRIYHRNLASFVGYCDEGSNMGLISEYMANGNLKEHLLDSNEIVMSWERRLRIAVDAAQGLEYLHNGCKPPIIHRDVKTDNILLSETLEAKIADFGISRILPSDGFTHVSTAVMGTPGYLDPEYYFTTKLNEKSDVFSFGVVLLELITGQSAITKSSVKIHIVQWVTDMLANGEIRMIVDPRLQGDFGINSILRALEVAMTCIPATSIQRPTMSYVLAELKDCLAIETSRERTSVFKEDLNKNASHSTDFIGIDLQDTTGPSAR